jgi:hypothetical protein
MSKPKWLTANTPKTKHASLPSTKGQRVAANVVMHQFARSEVRSLDNDSSGLRQRVRDKLWAMPEFERLWEIRSNLIRRIA